MTQGSKVNFQPLYRAAHFLAILTPPRMLNKKHRLHCSRINRYSFSKMLLNIISFIINSALNLPKNSNIL